MNTEKFYFKCLELTGRLLVNVYQNGASRYIEDYEAISFTKENPAWGKLYVDVSNWEAENWKMTFTIPMEHLDDVSGEDFIEKCKRFCELAFDTFAREGNMTGGRRYGVIASIL